MEMKIVVVGLGGVGSILVRRLCRFLNYSNDIDSEILLVDGDAYEVKNQERQEFMRMGNKAEVQANELQVKFKNITFDYNKEYISKDNVSQVIKEGDIVFMGVDNHKTRKIISDYCKTLAEVTLISGGNEYTDGNAQLYVRRDSIDLAPDICKYHPEIQNPTDKLPSEMSCEELSKSEPQLYFTNLGVAYNMCCMFYNSVIRKQYERSEVYFDILTMDANSKMRTVN